MRQIKVPQRPLHIQNDVRRRGATEIDVLA